MRKIILDTDIGNDIDDALCISYLLRQEGFSFEGVTTVGGESDRRAMMADAICKHIGRKVPIYVGADRPITKNGKQVDATQAENVDNWPHTKTFPKEHAVEFLRRKIEENPGEIELLAIGPLTNIGLLFAMYPHTAKMLKKLVIMGGKFFEEFPEWSEWNIRCDVAAARAVFDSDAEIYAVGLDVTLKVTLGKDEAKEKFEALNDLAPVSDFIKIWFRSCETVTFHDPLAATVLFDDKMCSFKRGSVDVDLSTDGITRFTESADGKHFVADSVDVNRFYIEYFKNLK